MKQHWFSCEIYQCQTKCELRTSLALYCTRPSTQPGRRARNRSPSALVDCHPSTFIKHPPRFPSRGRDPTAHTRDAAAARQQQYTHHTGAVLLCSSHIGATLEELCRQPVCAACEHTGRNPLRHYRRHILPHLHALNTHTTFTTAAVALVQRHCAAKGLGSSISSCLSICVTLQPAAACIPSQRAPPCY